MAGWFLLPFLILWYLSQNVYCYDDDKSLHLRELQNHKMWRGIFFFTFIKHSSKHGHFNGFTKCLNIKNPHSSPYKIKLFSFSIHTNKQTNQNPRGTDLIQRNRVTGTELFGTWVPKSDVRDWARSIPLEECGEAGTPSCNSKAKSSPLQSYLSGTGQDNHLGLLILSPVFSPASILD